MSDKLISILMPVKNTEKYIYDSVQSILSQTYNNFELIIIDDGSTDRTVEIIERIKDERIKLYKRDSKGLIEQLNFGLQEARGELIARMDGDDIALQEKLKMQIEYLSQNPDVQIIGTNFYFIDENNKVIINKNLPEHHENIEFMMPIIDSVLHTSILTYKKVLVDSGGYSNEYQSSEDIELFLRLISQGYKMHNLQKPLYKYRMTDKPHEYYEKQKSNHYKIGLMYLENFYKEKNGNYYFRMSLLEYYRGSIKMAKENLLKCLKFKDVKKRYVFRYLPVALLGDRIVNFLRKKKISSKINFLIKNSFNYDTYNIIGEKIKK